MSSKSLAWPIQLEHQITLLRIGTGSASGMYFPLGTRLAEIFNQQQTTITYCSKPPCKDSKILALAQLAGGSKANIEELARKTIELGLVQADIAYGAYHGQSSFGFNSPYACLRVLSNLYPEHLHIVVHRDADITQITDLRGRKVALDDPGSGTLFTARLVLSAAGISEADFKPTYLKPELAVKEFAEGKLDAFFMVIAAPASLISQLANTTPLRLLPVSRKIAKALTRSHPYLVRDKLPDNIYPNMPTVDTLAVAAQLLVHADLDEALVYQLSQILWQGDTHAALSQIHSGLYLGTEHSLTDLELPLHPGTLRYLQEQGLQIQQTLAASQGCPVNPSKYLTGLSE